MERNPNAAQMYLGYPFPEHHFAMSYFIEDVWQRSDGVAGCTSRQGRWRKPGSSHFTKEHLDDLYSAYRHSFFATTRIMHRIDLIGRDGFSVDVIEIDKDLRDSP
jgi:hypothetical protein